MGFKKETFNFSKNLTLVVGPNGSGKSSILEALALSFQIKERGNSVNTYIYKNATSAQIDLTAIWLEKPLTISSVFSKKGRKITRLVTYDDQTLENTAANNFLSKYFNEKSLIISFALQGNERFLTNSKMQNFKNFMELLQIDFNKELNLTKNLIKTTKQDVTTQIAQLHTHEGALQYINKQLEDIKQALSLLEIPPVPISKEVIEQLEKTYELKSHELKTLLDEKNGFEEIQKNLATLEKNITIDEKSLQDVQENLKSVQIPTIQDCNAIKEDFEQKKHLLESIQQQIQEIQQQKVNLSTKLNIEQQRQNQIKIGVCPTCLQKVSDVVLQSNIETIQQLRTQICQHESDQVSLKNDSSLISVEIKTLKEKIDTIEKVNQQIPWMLQNKQHMEQTANALTDKIAQAKKRKQDLESKAVSVSFEKISTLEQELNTLKGQKKIYETQNQSVAVFNSKKNTLEQSLQEQLQQFKNIEIEKNNCSVKVQELEQSLNEYVHIQQLFENIPKIHTQSVIKELEALMDASAKLFGYAGIRIEMDDDGLDFFLIKSYTENGELFKIEIAYHMCSSFQKNLINISCVLALCTIFDVPFICIDELDANADKNNTLKISPLIHSMLLKAPVVSVTHSESLASELLKTGEDVAILKLKHDLVKQESFENEEF